MEQKHRKTFEKVAQWLEAGAPHEETGMGFCMAYVQTDIENSLDFEDILEEYRSEGVDPNWLTPACGSVGCIGGAFLQFSGVKTSFSLESEVAAMLGYHYDSEEYNQMYRLFYPSNNDDYGWSATPQEAAKVLRGWLETGVADWGQLRGD